jgi:phosphatidylglycerophosphatase A
MRLGEKLVATGLGTGYLPVAPATFGSLLALLLWFTLIPQHPALRCLLISVAFFYGVNLSARLSVEWGKDPRRIVVDEISGMWLVLLLVPKGLWPGIAGFLVFRAFDVVKPAPIRRVEALGKGWGIMLDDVLAAGYTVCLIRLLFLISHQSH